MAEPDGIESSSAAAFGARRRARRRAAAVVLGASAVVIVIVVATSGLLWPSRHAGAPGAIRSSGLPTPRTSPLAGGVGTHTLARYHWRNLPDAPIALRSEGVVGVWTGSRLLVWGGASSAGAVFADGASYDPTAHAWQKLPASPLGPRVGAAYAWTGQDLFVWGGRSNSRSTTAVASGATYDPSTRRWHRLPPLAVPDAAITVAVWTGTHVALLTAAGGQDVTTVDVHAYNPGSDAWTTLPSIHINQSDLLDVSALVGSGRLYVWMPVQTFANGSLHTGNDGFVYQPATNTWTATDLLPAQGQYSVGAALWTGDHILFQPNGLECSCGGIPGASTGSWADPRTGSVIPVPAYPADQPGPAAFIWTGQVALAIDGVRTASWDPASAKWAPLASAPYQGGAVQVWTGTTLLVWGQLFAPPSSEPNAGSPPQVVEPTGLEFSG